MNDDTQTPAENLPQIQTVFVQPDLHFDSHEWQQEGYMVRDICNPGKADCHNGGIPIPQGFVLIKKDGHYDLRPEIV